MNDAFIEILIGKAQTLQDCGQLAEARALLEEAIALAPSNPAGQAALGKVCGHLKDHPQAIKHLETARKLADEDLETLFTLGYEYSQVGRYAEAIACFDTILQWLPDYPALLRWRGFALAQSGRGEEAWKDYEKALQLKPDYDAVLAGMANLLILNKHIEEAETYFLRALSIAPDVAAYHNDLGRVYRQQGRMEAAVDCSRRALELDPGCLPAVSNILYGLCYLDTMSPEQRAHEHCRFAQRYYPPPEQSFKPRIVSNCGERLNIGYMSGDFGTHSVSYFIEPVLVNHDRGRFKIFCYSNRGVPDETTQRIKALDVTWRNIMGVPAESVAAHIAKDGIHILVDLSGHSAGHRLDVMALRPAPVQASWIGYPHSTGLRQIDYYISDNLCDPPGLTDQLFSETVWRMPRIFSCYLPPVRFPAVTPPPFLANGYIIFGCFNNFCKINHSVLTVWASLLRTTPGSKLVLKSAALKGPALQKTVHNQFAELGISNDRIILLPFAATTEEHLAQYGQVDIALDTFPYHGTTTTCEALWMGVPVVSLSGSDHLSRVGVSFLHAVGLDNLVTATPEDYIKCATELSQDAHRLVHLRENLRAMMARSPLMDAIGVTREVEDAFMKMYCKNSGRVTS